MAGHRPSYQLHTFNAGQPSFRVVDGKKSNLDYYGSQCTSTQANKVFAMWWVDLQKPRPIERIIVYSRTDNLKWGKMSYLFILIRNTNSINSTNYGPQTCSSSIN